MKHTDIQTLASRVEGPVLLPEDEGYDEERTGPPATTGAASAS